MSKTIKTSGVEPIVFFGSGPVAAASLDFLADHFPIEAVITKAKPPHHQDIAPVEALAQTKGLKICYASTKQELDDLIAAKAFSSRLGVIVDYGVIVSKQTIETFELGIVNSHFSLLPRWRGADPITFAILQGDEKTGVSLMLIEPELDTGKLLVQKSLPITTIDTTPSLTQKLIELSNGLLLEYLPRYLANQLTPRQQPHPSRATYSRKLIKADGDIDWYKPADEIERQIRAFSGWPGSRTILGGKQVTITKARVVSDNGAPGEVKADKNQLIVYTKGKALKIERLKPAGKIEMSGSDFIRGYLN